MRTLLLTLRLVMALHRAVQAYQQFQLVQSYDLFAASLVHIIEDETKRWSGPSMTDGVYKHTVTRVRHLLETLIPGRVSEL